jgi:hypothetical protein
VADVLEELDEVAELGEVTGLEELEEPELLHAAVGIATSAKMASMPTDLRELQRR